MTNLTMEQIGKMAGVSRATVSRVINNQPGVGNEVRERVKRIIKETGFSPNVAARSMATDKTNVVGLVIPSSVQTFFEDPYFSRLMQGIAQAANYHDYTFSIFLIENNEMEERIIPRITNKGAVDGLIIHTTSADRDLLDRVMSSSIPYVFAGRPLGLENENYIDVDNVKGAEIGVNHLIHLGRKKIATITGSMDVTPGRDRLIGYKNALTKNNIKVDDNLIQYGDFSESGGYYATKELLRYQPDSIFIANDLMAIGAVKAIKESNLTIPGDIAIVGYDDLPPARFSDPPLSTIRQPILRFGIAAMDILLNCINDQDSIPQQTILDVELVIRESCGAK